MWETAILGACQTEPLWIAKSEVGEIFVLSNGSFLRVLGKTPILYTMYGNFWGG